MASTNLCRSARFSTLVLQCNHLIRVDKKSLPTWRKGSLYYYRVSLPNEHDRARKKVVLCENCTVRGPCHHTMYAKTQIAWKNHVGFSKQFEYFLAIPYINISVNSQYMSKYLQNLQKYLCTELLKNIQCWEPDTTYLAVYFYEVIATASMYLRCNF